MSTIETHVGDLKTGPEGEPSMTAEEAGAYLRVHIKTLQKMAREGRVPGHWYGGHWYFLKSELDAWRLSQVRWPRHPCRD